MAATIKWYGKGVEHLAEGRVDLDTDTIKLSLHTSTYTPNQDTDDFFDDATNELSASGNYTAGGETLASVTGTYDAASNEGRFDAADVTWTALTPSAAFRYGVIRKSRGGAASADELIGYIDFGANQDPGGSNFTVQWHANGILKITAA